MTKRPKNTTPATTAAPAPAAVKHITPEDREAAHHRSVIRNATELQHALQAAANRSAEEAVLLRRVTAFLSHSKDGAT